MKDKWTIFCRNTTNHFQSLRKWKARTDVLPFSFTRWGKSELWATGVTSCLESSLFVVQLFIFHPISCTSPWRFPHSGVLKMFVCGKSPCLHVGRTSPRRITPGHFIPLPVCFSSPYLLLFLLFHRSRHTRSNTRTPLFSTLCPLLLLLHASRGAPGSKYIHIAGSSVTCCAAEPMWINHNLCVTSTCDMIYSMHMSAYLDFFPANLSCTHSQISTAFSACALKSFFWKSNSPVVIASDGGGKKHLAVNSVCVEVMRGSCVRDYSELLCWHGPGRCQPAILTLHFDLSSGEVGLLWLQLDSRVLLSWE